MGLYSADSFETIYASHVLSPLSDKTWEVYGALTVFWSTGAMEHYSEQ